MTKRINFIFKTLQPVQIGGLNVLAGLMSATSSVTGLMGRYETNFYSKFALRLLSEMIAGGTETVYDFVSWLYGRITSKF